MQHSALPGIVAGTLTGYSLGQLLHGSAQEFDRAHRRDRVPVPEKFHLSRQAVDRRSDRAELLRVHVGEPADRERKRVIGVCCHG